MFHLSEDDARQFLRAIAEYEMTVADVNARLDVSDNLATTEKNTAVIGAHRRTVQTSTGFKSFKERHQKLYNFLEMKYPWSLKHIFPDG